MRVCEVRFSEVQTWVIGMSTEVAVIQNLPSDYHPGNKCLMTSIYIYYPLLGCCFLPLITPEATYKG